MKAEKKKRLLPLLPGMLLSLGLSFMLFLYAPFELYLTNRDDFWFSAGQLLGNQLLFFFGSLLLSLLVLMLARRLGGVPLRLVTALLCWLLICFYVQGNFLVSRLPGLDGSQVSWGAYPAERLKSLLCWLLGAVLVALPAWKLGPRGFGRLSCFLGAGLTLMLALTLGVLALSGGSGKREVLASTDLELLEFSKQDNFLILHLDAVDACAFEQVIAGDPDFTGDFRDFTYYDNAMSGYPYTKCSVAQILTGQWYEGQERFDSFLDGSLQEAPLFRALEDRSYRQELYLSDSIYLSRDLYEGRIANLRPDEAVPTSKREMMLMGPRMTAVKYAPWDLKRLGYRLQDILPVIRGSRDTDDYRFFSSSNAVFFEKLQGDGAVTVREEPGVFKYVLLEGAHVPYRYDRDMNIIENGSYTQNIEASLTIARTLLQRMKDAGVYDRSVIVILADHGFNEDYDDSNLRQHPMLLIKGRGEEKPFTVDSSPVSYADLQDAFVRLLDGCAGDACFTLSGEQARERRFLNYDWRDLTYFEEFVQTGRAEDRDTLLPTGRVFGN